MRAVALDQPADARAQQSDGNRQHGGNTAGEILAETALLQQRRDQRRDCAKAGAHEQHGTDERDHFRRAKRGVGRRLEVWHEVIRQLDREIHEPGETGARHEKGIKRFGAASRWR